MIDLKKESDDIDIHLNNEINRLKEAAENKKADLNKIANLYSKLVESLKIVDLEIEGIDIIEFNNDGKIYKIILNLKTFKNKIFFYQTYRLLSDSLYNACKNKSTDLSNKLKELIL